MSLTSKGTKVYLGSYVPIACNNVLCEHMASCCDKQRAWQLDNLVKVEADRIRAILEETYSKLRLLSLVPPLQLPDEPFLSAGLGTDVLELLAEQALLEKQYSRATLSSGPKQSDSAIPHNPDDFETLNDKLRHSTRVVCRELFQAPSIAEQVQKGSQRAGGAVAASGVMQSFIRTLRLLIDQTEARLQTPVEEDTMQHEWFEGVSSREQTEEETLRKLQQETEDVKVAHVEEIAAMNATISTLEDQLKMSRRKTSDEVDAINARSKESEDGARNAFQAREAALSEEIEKFVAELAQRKGENQRSEETLRQGKVCMHAHTEAESTKLSAMTSRASVGINSHLYRQIQYLV